jgi:hypothetical protein
LDNRIKVIVQNPNGTMWAVVPLDLLQLEGSTQPREEINQAVVQEYQDLYERNTSMPPLTVFYDDADYWLVDGFHRFHAARQAGKKSIQCVIRQGFLEQARWFSYGVNKDHGLHRTNGDKAKAVHAALAHPKGAAMSDGAIAEHVGVSDRMVAKYRAELTPQFSESKRIGRDGRTIRITGIGKAKPKAPPPPVQTAEKPGPEPVTPAPIVPKAPAPITATSDHKQFRREILADIAHAEEVALNEMAAVKATCNCVPVVSKWRQAEAGVLQAFRELNTHVRERFNRWEPRPPGASTAGRDYETRGEKEK